MLARSNTATLEFPQTPARQVIRAKLIGSDTCSALGITSQSNTPVLEICRRLIAAGHDSATPLAAYRGAVLCLHVRSIDEAARLTVKAMGNGAPSFTTEGTAGCATAPPMRRNRRGVS